MPNAKPLKGYTLLLIHEPPRVLLGMKKRKFGEGKWNGFGGKVEEGETVEQAARRELQEEAGIDVRELTKAGVILCEFLNEPFVREVHVFRGSGVIGEPTESEEMLPQWFDVAAIPFERMWPSDKVWFDAFLNGTTFCADVVFDEAKNLIRGELI